MEDGDTVDCVIEQTGGSGVIEQTGGGGGGTAGRVARVASQA
jgi:hypothetical protein